MIVGVPKESFPGERRVALVPAVIPNLAKAGLEVLIEKDAGSEAGYPDARLREKGAKIVPDRAAVFAAADIVTQVLCYGSNDRTGKADLPLMRRDQVLIGFLRPLGSREIRSGNRRHGRDLLFRRTDAAHHARAEHGRAFLDGHDLRLQGRADRRGHAAAAFSHADHRGRHDYARARPDHRRRRRRTCRPSPPRGAWARWFPPTTCVPP